MPIVSRSKASPRLRDWLAGQGGAVPFRRFMEAALYDPEFGYYSRQIQTVGARGDFSTSATLSPLLGRGIAGWMQRFVRENGGEIRDVIEIGPGTGQLHAAVRGVLGLRGRWHWRSHLVERSPNLRAAQRQLLGKPGRRLQWHESPGEALASAGGRALIFSNEVVDAFPVTLLQRHGGVWQEVWLEVSQTGAVVEALRPGVVPGTSVKAADIKEGQRVEVHESWREWLLSWRQEWKAGKMLTIDYGALADSLYYRQPHGTLRGYQNHRRLDGLAIYQNPGQCDLTADVNFTDLRQWGDRIGLAAVSCQSQAEFLKGVPLAGAAADAGLTDPAGAGGAFMVLEQLAGI